MKIEILFAWGISSFAMLGGLVRSRVSTVIPASRLFPWGTLCQNYLDFFCLIFLVKGYLVYKGTSKVDFSTGDGFFCGVNNFFQPIMLDSVKLLDTGRYFSLVVFSFLSIGGGLLLAYFLGGKMVIASILQLLVFGALVRYLFSRFIQELLNSFSELS